MVVVSCSALQVSSTSTKQTRLLPFVSLVIPPSFLYLDNAADVGGGRARAEEEGEGDLVIKHLQYRTTTTTTTTTTTRE